MEIKGRLIRVLPIESGTSARGAWKKQSYVIETVDTQFPKQVCFMLWGDKVDQYQLKEGELILVSFDLESREFNNRWYTDVRAWKIDRPDPQTGMFPGAQAPAYGAPQGQAYPQQPAYQQPYQQPQQGFGAAPQQAPATPDFGAASAPSGDDLPF
jgi:single-stranded DNA-binding protein